MVSETRMAISVSLLWYPDGPFTSGSGYVAGVGDGDVYIGCRYTLDASHMWGQYHYLAFCFCVWHKTWMHKKALILTASERLALIRIVSHLQLQCGRWVRCDLPPNLASPLRRTEEEVSSSRDPDVGPPWSNLTGDKSDSGSNSAAARDDSQTPSLLPFHCVQQKVWPFAFGQDTAFLERRHRFGYCTLGCGPLSSHGGRTRPKAAASSLCDRWCAGLSQVGAYAHVWCRIVTIVTSTLFSKVCNLLWTRYTYFKIGSADDLDEQLISAFCSSPKKRYCSCSGIFENGLNVLAELSYYKI